MSDIQPGDRVTTHYTGRRTEHVITHRRDGIRNSQTGVGFRVDPPLRTWRDRSNPYDEWPEEYYDSGWFRSVEGSA